MVRAEERIGSTVIDSSPAAGSVFGGALISVVSMLVHCESVSGSLYLVLRREGQ
jgi:hypothetical protein